MSVIRFCNKCSKNHKSTMEQTHVHKIIKEMFLIAEELFVLELILKFTLPRNLTF